MQFNSTEEILVFLQNEIKHRETETSRFRDETIKTKNFLKVEKEKHRQIIATLAETIQFHESNLKREKEKTNEMTKIYKIEKETLDANVTSYGNAFTSNSLLNKPYQGVEKYTSYTTARLGLLPLVKVEQLKPEYGPVVNDVLSFRYHNNIPPCHEVTANRSIFIAVISAPGNFDRRNLIRQTWRKHLNSNQYGVMGLAGFGFSLGTTEDKLIQSKIDEESKIYRDILQIEKPDFYRNLTVKLTALFNWLYLNCASVDFVFKVDDDVYVNVRNFVQLIQILHPSNHSIIGSAGSLAPNRSKATFLRSKWRCVYLNIVFRFFFLRWEMGNLIRGVALGSVSSVYFGRSRFDSPNYNLPVVSCFSDHTVDTF